VGEGNCKEREKTKGSPRGDGEKRKRRGDSALKRLGWVVQESCIDRIGKKREAGMGGGSEEWTMGALRRGKGGSKDIFARELELVVILLSASPTEEPSTSF